MPFLKICHQKSCWLVPWHWRLLYWKHRSVLSSLPISPQEIQVNAFPFEISISCPADKMVQTIKNRVYTSYAWLSLTHFYLWDKVARGNYLLSWITLCGWGGTACGHSSSPTHRHIYEELRKSEEDLMASVQVPEAWNLKSYPEHMDVTAAPQDEESTTGSQGDRPHASAPSSQLAWDC